MMCGCELHLERGGAAIINDKARTAKARIHGPNGFSNIPGTCQPTYDPGQLIEFSYPGFNLVNLKIAGQQLASLNFALCNNDPRFLRRLDIIRVFAFQKVYVQT
jgi:hypothetical protein